MSGLALATAHDERYALNWYRELPSPAILPPEIAATVSPRSLP